MTSVKKALADKHVLSSVALFLTASVWQFQTHSTLSSLRPSHTTKQSYSSPPKSSLSFRLFLTPHYSAEILLYLSLYMTSRSTTILAALIWTIVNLSITAEETRRWARGKFPSEKQWGKWNLMPFMF
jgi:3-oxo-5-alpha-steroid 4-dehydrogenase 3 / polyprenol reductase